MRNLRIHRNHFIEGAAGADRLFAFSVTRIEIEVSSYCNRTCSFCPNSFIDRRSERRYMDDKLYSSIMRQLGGIGFSGSIGFHRYNEPLASRPYILGRIAEARHKVPQATLTINTNGDYLDRDFIGELYLAGCRSIYVSMYLPEGRPYSDEAMDERMHARMTEWGYPFIFTCREAGNYQAKMAAFPDMEILVCGQDFFRPAGEEGNIVAYDRGGSLAINKRYRRTSPCEMPFTQLQVQWNGDVLPCCQLRSDIPEHRQAVLATLTPSSNIFEVWVNRNFTAWRRDLIGWQPKAPPCATCDYVPFEDHPALRAMTEQVLRGAGVPELVTWAEPPIQPVEAET